MSGVRRALALLAPLVVVVALTAPAQAGDGWDGHNHGGGTDITGVHPGGSTPGLGGHPGDQVNYPAGSNKPVYEDYYTPSCSVNGPPGAGSADAMCMAAVSVCKARGIKDAIYMQHWRRQVSPTTSGWGFAGNVCRGPDAPTQPQPQVTVPMVLDAAYAAAPRPTVEVQPGDKSYVNFPNNYYADSPTRTVDVVVLGQTIPVTFTVTDISWDFGDGGTGSGPGIENAELHQPGAVEHQYAQQGTYAITATSVLTVSFTAPGLGQQQIPGALHMTSNPTRLPIGEIQTRVDSTG